jgi:maltose alpha-D-glucosyltransferase / alpha-amylase
MTGILPSLLQNQRWFGAKARTISEVKILDSGELPGTGSLLTLISVSYTDGPAHLYFVPMLGTSDAVTDGATCSALLSLMENESRVSMQRGSIQGRRSAGFTRSEASLTPRLIKSEQSNSSIIFGDLLIMKLFRRQQPGENPDCEISRYLTEHTKFRRIPAFAGSIEYHDGSGETYTLAMLQRLVPNEGDGWQWTLEQLEAGKGAESSHVSTFQAAATLGQRTAEMHAALATFAPEALTAADLRQLAADMTERATATIARLDQALPNQHALSTYARLRDLNPGSLRIRIHGDYHLGQVLRVPNDFVILDFEGEPTSPLTARRAKHCPLKDVAGMLRSFSYASYTGLPNDQAQRGKWEQSVSTAFLEAYRSEAGATTFLPADEEAFTTILEAYVLDKAFYELNYEMDNRPDWLRIPLAAIFEETRATPAR